VFWIKEDAMDKSDGVRDKRADWVDFERVKAEVPWPDVLGALGLLAGLERAGDELRGKCPFCGQGKETSFSVNVKKRVFQTFCCKRRGNILDFARLSQQVDLKTAGKWLAQFLPDERAAPAPEVTELTPAAAAAADGTDDPVEASVRACVEAMVTNLLPKLTGITLHDPHPLINQIAAWLSRRLKE